MELFVIQNLQQFRMYNPKKKQKTVTDKQFQDQIKQIKNSLADGKALVERASSNEDYYQAIQIFNKTISKFTTIQFSNSYLLLYYRGICYLNLKDYSKAERDFIQASSLADDKGKIQVYNFLGRCKAEMAEEDPSYFEQAIDSYTKAIQFSKNTDGQAQLKLAQIYRKLKNNKQAIKHYSNSIKCPKFTQQFEAYMERGLCLRQSGDLKSSIEDFMKACQLRKDSGSAYFNLGVNYLLDFKYETALQNLDIAIELNPSQPQHKNYKGLAFYMNKQYESCLGIYREALKLYQDLNISNSEVSQCWYNLGNAHLYLNEPQQAIKAYKMAESYEITTQQKVKIFYSSGLAYEKCQFQNQNQIVTKDQKQIQTRYNIEAINKFQQSLILISENKEHQLYLSSLYHLSFNQFKYHKYAEALREVNKIVEEGCRDKYVYELRGKIYLELQKFELALKDFEGALSLNPNSSQIYYYLGMAKSNLGDVDGAFADFFKAASLGSKNINLMNGISYAYLKIGKPEKALVYINLALEKIPNNQNFLIQRSMVYLQLGQNHKGIQDLTDALKMNDKNSYTYYRRGLTYYKSKKFDQAIEDLRRSLQYEPTQQILSDIYYLIGVSYANKQEYQSAIQPFTKAIEAKKVAKYYHERAKCFILLDQGKQATQDLNQVIAMQPQNAYAYFRRGLAYKSLKMYEESAQNFMKARELSPDDPKLILNKKQIYQIKFRKLCEPGEEL